MQVTCGFCGAVHEMDDSIAPSSGVIPSCPVCQGVPQGNGAGDYSGFGTEPAPNADMASQDRFPSAFDNLEDDLAEDRDKTTTYDLAGLQASVQSMLNGQARRHTIGDELFETSDTFLTGEESEEAAPASSVQADDLFALFGAPQENSSDPALDAAAAASQGGQTDDFSLPAARSTDGGAVPSGSLSDAMLSPQESPVLPRMDTRELFGDSLPPPPPPEAIPAYSSREMPEEDPDAAFQTVRPGEPLGNNLFGDFSAAEPLSAAPQGSPVPQQSPAAPESVPGSFDGSGDLLAALGLSMPPMPAQEAPLPSAIAAPDVAPHPSSAAPDLGGLSGSGSGSSGISTPAFGLPLEQSPSLDPVPEIDFGRSASFPADNASEAQSGTMKAFDAAPVSPLPAAGGPKEQSFPEMHSSPPPSAEVGLELDLGGFGQNSARKNFEAGKGTPSSSPSDSFASKSPASSLMPARRKKSGGGGLRIAAFGLLTAAVLGGVFFIWNYSGSFFSGQKTREQPPPPIAVLIEETVKTSPQIIEMAKLNSADELIQQGISLLRNDTAAGYREARDSFIQALAVSPNRADAMALYVEATLHVRPTENYLPACREILDLALVKMPQASLPHRVNAFLLLREEKENEAIEEADKAASLALPEEKADALLMQGYATLGKSAAVALEKIAQAVQLDPKLKRAVYYQGLAAEKSGDLLKAAKAYDARLAIDAKERDSMQGLIRVYLNLGHLGDARKTLASYLKFYPNDLAPQLWEAALVLRLERDAPRAAQILRKVEKTLEQLNASEKILFYRLNAERLIAAKDYSAAKKAVDAAIELDPRDGAAHFLGVKVAIAQRKADEARPHLEACRRFLPNGLYREFKGRLALMDGNLDEALENFQKANEENSLRIASLVMEGVLQLKKGNERAAWSLHSRILSLDPFSRSKEAPSVDDFSEPERAIFELARANMGRMPAKASDSTQWLYTIYTALLAYHLGDTVNPSRAFDQVIAGDPTSLISLVYRAQIELDRKNYKKSKKFIDTAIHVDSRAPMPWYLRGRLFSEQKDLRNARDSWAKVLELTPRHIDAEIQLALLSVAQGDKNDALSRFRRVLVSNPNLYRVRSALFDLERSEKTP